MRALVIGHDHVAGIEHLGDELERLGFDLDWLQIVPRARFSRPNVAVTFPDDPTAWDLLVTLGAPWPREQIAGWTKQEKEFLAKAHDVGTPILGICFGAQLLAEALGATTATLPNPRIGWHPVTPRVPQLAPGPWFQWHADQLTAPPGAEVLAESVDGVEAFRAGRAVGVQFHPEMTARLLERWFLLPGEATAGLDLDALRAQTARHAPAAASRSRQLIELLN